MTAQESQPQQPQEKASAAKPIPTRNMVHIAVIVKDIEKASKAWADMFGMEVPKWSLNDPPEKSNILYRGKTTEARLKTAFFKFDNLRVELMEPVGGPSTWMDFLKSKGEGVHHIAFDVKGIDGAVVTIAQYGQVTSVTTGTSGIASFKDLRIGTVTVNTSEKYNNR